MENMDMANLTSSQREDVMGKVRAQVAQAQAAEMISRVNDRCLKKCIDYPGTSLTGTQQIELKTCLGRCMERYFETWNVVSNAYQKRIVAESGGGGMR